MEWGVQNRQMPGTSGYTSAARSSLSRHGGCNISRGCSVAALLCVSPFFLICKQVATPVPPRVALVDMVSVILVGVVMLPLLCVSPFFFLCKQVATSALPEKALVDMVNVTLVGLARTISIRCTYGIFGREITKCAVKYGVYTRF